MKPITQIMTFGPESEFHYIVIYYSETIESYILEAVSKTTDLEDVLLIFPSRKHTHNKNPKALQSALRMAETLADIATL